MEAMKTNLVCFCFIYFWRCRCIGVLDGWIDIPFALGLGSELGLMNGWGLLDISGPVEYVWNCMPRLLSSIYAGSCSWASKLGSLTESRLVSLDRIKRGTGTYMQDVKDMV